MLIGMNQNLSFECLPFWCQESVIIGYSVVDNRNLWKISRLVAQCKISPALPFFIVVSFKLLEVTTTLSQAIFQVVQVVSSGSNSWQDAAFVARQLEDKIVVSQIRCTYQSIKYVLRYLKRHSFVGGFRDK